jgi:predicted amidophosphoribosyltransferase
MLSRMIDALSELLFPRSKDESAIKDETPKRFEDKYTLIYIERDTYALSHFRDGSVRAAVHLNKFHNHERAQQLLAALVRMFLTNAHFEHAYCIPVPLGSERMRERKHNQVTSVLTKALDTTQLPRYTLLKEALIRTRETPPQTTLGRTDRLTNLKGAFAMSSKAIPLLTDTDVLIFDDVTTTGATLKEAARIIREAKPRSITCIAFAH